MKRFAHILLHRAASVALAAVLCLTVAAPASSQRTAAARRQPNFVIIYADDLGYGDLSAYGARAIKTPNIDRLAREGMKLTNFYSIAPVCTPSRAGLLTGRYPARMGIEQMHLSDVLFPNDKSGLPQSETTIARALKTRGYRTAAIGKWHLGHVSPYLPTDH